MTGKDSASQEGYLRENYRYFHLRDTVGQERDYHFHDFDKVVVLLSGQVDYVVENVTYAMRPWDIVLIRHHAIHKALIDVRQPYERIILYLDRQYLERTMPGAGLADCFEAAEGQCLLSPGESQRAALRERIAAYERAAADDQFGAEALRDTIILQLLILLNRTALGTAGETGRTDRQYDPKISGTLSYINENLAGELTVDRLAERVYLSKYHFMRLFKAQTGATVHAYVRQRRLLYAARLIREGVAVNRAAADCGFSDYSTFYRAFRESFGTSPAQLKR